MPTFDRYANMKPKAFSSMEEYNAYFKHVHRVSQKDKLIREANTAIGWGRPDRESTGYSTSEFIDLISRMRRFIEQNT
jgi:hypothetical protein